MKYGIVILVVLGIGCGCLAYRLGVYNCRKSVAEEKTEVQTMVEQRNQRIEEKVLSIPSNDNLNWLLVNWKRAD